MTTVESTKSGEPIELKQRYLLQRFHFFLEPARLRLVQSDATSQVEVFVPYENLTSSRRQLVLKSRFLYGWAGIVLAMSVIGTIVHLAGVIDWAWLVAPVISTPILYAGYFLSQRRYLLLDTSDGNPVSLLQDNPSEAEVKTFLATLDRKRRTYLRETYFRRLAHRGLQEEFAKLQWLLGAGVIDEGEYGRAREELEAEAKREPEAPSEAVQLH